MPRPLENPVETGYAVQMKSALLHIGPHKTGSTYLQACFAHHRVALLDRGIALPGAWENAPDSACHTGLVRALKTGDMAQATALVERSFEISDRILISAEDLSTLKADALARLRALFENAKVDIIYYVRRWSDLLPSAWQEMVKHGHTLTFPEHFAAHVRNPHASQLFNLDMKLGSFMDAFGRDSVRIVCYSFLRDNAIDLFVHFADKFLNWHDATPLPTPHGMNASRDPMEIELVRSLNVIEFVKTGQRSAALRGRLDAMRGQIDAEVILHALKKHRSSIMFNDSFHMLREFHTDMYTRYQQNIVQPCPRELFFRPTRQELPYINSDYLMETGVVNSLHAIHTQIMTPSNA